MSVHVYTLTEPNTIHMFWQLPQYVLLTLAEILVAITGYHFAYDQVRTKLTFLHAESWWNSIKWDSDPCPGPSEYEVHAPVRLAHDECWWELDCRLLCGL